MAEIVLRHEASRLGLANRLVVDSAGTAAEVGCDIDRRARKALERRGYRPHHHRARQFDTAWWGERELMVALDRGHLRRLQTHAPGQEYAERVRLLLSFPPASAHEGGPLDVPDPYYGDDREFESCLDLVELGCAGLLTDLATELAL